MGVVVQPEIDLRADGGLHVELYVVVEVEEGMVARSFGQGGVLRATGLHAHLHLRRPLRLDAYTSGAEHPISGTDVETHVHQVQLFATCLSEVLVVSLAIIGLHRLLHAVLLVLLGSHGDGCAELHVAHACTDDIPVREDVVLNGGLQIVRVVEVGRHGLCQVAVEEGSGACHGEAWLAQRSDGRGDGVLARGVSRSLRCGAPSGPEYGEEECKEKGRTIGATCFHTDGE